jgi:hypothetical protein
VSTFAQFFGLATPADGTRVYFTTPSRQKDTAQNPYGKVSQYGPTGLQLTLSRDPVGNPPALLSNAYDLWASDASADGSVLAIGGIRHCLGSDVVLCSKNELFSTTVNTNGRAQDYPGMLKVSANGKWAFGGGSQSNIGSSNQLGYLVNLATGEVKPITQADLKGLDFMYVASAARPVANDGTAVFTTGARQEPFARLVSQLMCDDRATMRQVEILFAGLAPGLVGVYQIDWQVPSGAPASPLFLSCFTDRSPSFGGVIAVGGARGAADHNLKKYFLSPCLQGFRALSTPCPPLVQPSCLLLLD